ncbi:hypothetical protein Tco_0189236 [Tanacetum coccineum]
MPFESFVGNALVIVSIIPSFQMEPNRYVLEITGAALGIHWSEPEGGPGSLREILRENLGSIDFEHEITNTRFSTVATSLPKKSKFHSLGLETSFSSYYDHRRESLTSPSLLTIEIPSSSRSLDLCDTLPHAIAKLNAYFVGTCGISGCKGHCGEDGTWCSLGHRSPIRLPYAVSHIVAFGDILPLTGCCLETIGCSWMNHRLPLLSDCLSG